MAVLRRMAQISGLKGAQCGVSTCGSGGPPIPAVSTRKPLAAARRERGALAFSAAAGSIDRPGGCPDAGASGLGADAINGDPAGVEAPELGGDSNPG